ncbi:hypothetical protein LTS17_001750 [Exophiala oligosperma]
MTKAYDDTVPMSSIPAFFPGHKLNYAENILSENPNPETAAVIGLVEGDDDFLNKPREVLSWRQFRERVRETSSALKRSGIKKGDRVAAIVGASVWAVVLFHATASMGAIFTSISPELGLSGCVSRLQQVQPSIIFFDSHAIYKAKATSTAEKRRQILCQLKPMPQVYVIPVTNKGGSVIDDDVPWIEEFLSRASASDELTFERVPFNHPLIICYSSGTTGTPKCIVHSHGLILQLKKISVVHDCLGPEDIVTQYASTSWVVFYGMCGHLSSGAGIVLYNGSPLYPDAKQLLRICDTFKVSFLGLSPRLLLEMEMSGAQPKLEFELSRLKTLHTTGAPLSAEQYQWISRAFPPDMQICNIAGGTENGTALIALDPDGPVRVGEMQTESLGISIDILDAETGESIADTGEPGELVITMPYPSMPSFFWGDKGGKIYREAYFERFSDKDVWAQHDWLKKNPSTGGFVMLGRSDGVLNPSGIRFGSGEIYAIVEKEPLLSYFNNVLCVGRRRPQDVDEQVFLFVVMKPATPFTSKIREEIKSAIRANLSPRHVPKFVLPVPDVPMTINGKRVETIIKKIISGKDVQPSATVTNPQSVEYFKRFRSLEQEPKDAKL